MQGSKRERIVSFVVVPIACVIGGAFLNRYIGPDPFCPPNISLSLSFIILTGLLSIAFLFSLFATLLNDAEKRAIAGSIAASAAGMFLLAGFAIGVATANPSPGLSDDDLIALAVGAEQRGDFEGAIARLQTLQGRGIGDEGGQRIRAKIERLERSQLDRAAPSLNEIQ